MVLIECGKYNIIIMEAWLCTVILNICCSRKHQYIQHGVFFWVEPPSPPPQHYLIPPEKSSCILAFTRLPFPLRNFGMTLHGGVCEYFVELHTMKYITLFSEVVVQ